MGKERQSVRKRPPPRGTNVIVRSVEASRSLADWGKLSAESLRLACNAVHIVSTGSRDAMARLLFDYHSTLSLTVSANATSIPVPSVLSVPVSVVNSPPSPSSFNMESFLRTELHSFLGRELPTLSGLSAAVTSEPIVSAAPTLIHATSLSPTSFDASHKQHNPSAINLGHIASSSTSPHHLPPLPQSILEQIRSGKFVNFDLLLPAVAPLASDEYTIKVNSGSEPSVLLVPRAQSRPRVFDFFTWLTAWNNFFQAQAFYFPHRLMELIHYQSLITKFACQYAFTAWYLYDKLFRYTMANNPSLTWATVDDDLFNQYIRGATLPSLCYHCHSYGHLAYHCPMRGSDHRVTSSASSVTSQYAAGASAGQPS